MAKAKATAHATSTISPVLQKLFVGAAGLMFVMQIVQNAYYMLQQLPDNDNFSAYYIWFLGTFIVMLIWLVIYLTRRNRTLSLPTLFEVTLVTVSVSMTMVGVGWLMSFLQLPLVSNKMLDDFSLYYALDIALPLMVTIPPLVIIIRRLRAQKQW